MLFIAAPHPVISEQLARLGAEPPPRTRVFMRQLANGRATTLRLAVRPHSGSGAPVEGDWKLVDVA